MKKLIGIPIYMQDNAKYPQEVPVIVVRATCINAILAAGGTPVCIPCVAAQNNLQHYIESIDGLMLIGGGDISPKRYGDPISLLSSEIDDTRDEIELELTQMAVRAGLPVFGICRGCLIINTAFGGSLIQDIKTQVPRALKHKLKDEACLNEHKITVSKNTLLWDILETDSVAVNSLHHQAIYRVAPGFTVSAVSTDGVIEAIENTSHTKPVFGVQFHPEEKCTEHVILSQLFTRFVQMC